MLDGHIAMHYLPLWIGGAILGRVRSDLAEALLRHPGVREAEVGLRLQDEGFSRAARSRLLQSVALHLRQEGLIADWRNEHCSVLDHEGHELARCERGAFRTLGLQNRAVHINGYRPDGLVWVARRSPLKRADPGMLDNLAAGGSHRPAQPLCSGSQSFDRFRLQPIPSSLPGSWPLLGWPKRP